MMLFTVSVLRQAGRHAAREVGTVPSQDPLLQLLGEEQLECCLSLQVLDPS